MSSASSGRVEPGASLTLSGTIFRGILSLEPEEEAHLSIDDLDLDFVSDHLSYGAGEIGHLDLDCPQDPLGIGPLKSQEGYRATIFCIRMARSSCIQSHEEVETVFSEEYGVSDQDDPRYLLRDNVITDDGRYVTVVHGYEYALILVKLAGNGSTLYKRIGMASEVRTSALADNVRDPSRMWAAQPGVFEIGGTECTITVV
jgi:hypothetical protein